MIRLNLVLEEDLVEFARKRAKLRYLSLTDYFRQLIINDRKRISDKLDVADVAE